MTPEQVGAPSWPPVIDVYTKMSPASVQVLLIRKTVTGGKEVAYRPAGACRQVAIRPEPVRRQ